jgi:23S rRNA (guanosine2251-2'-O)-methyltransferase
MSQLEKIYGVHAVEALLRHHPKRVKQIWLAESRNDPRVQTLVELANENRVQVGQAERREMDAWVEGVHQGVVAEVSPSQVWGEAMLDELLDRTEGAPLLLVLDGVTDPHNLGACLRSADAAGALAVIVPKDKSATLTPVVRKVACGAAEVIPLVAVTNLARTLEKLQQRGLWIVGTAGEAEVSIYDQDLTGPTILIMGAEGKGMRRLTREHCDYLVKLPMAGSVSSLNVSVATGVCLFEAQRQRGAKAKALAKSRTRFKCGSEPARASLSVDVNVA